MHQNGGGGKGRYPKQPLFTSSVFQGWVSWGGRKMKNGKTDFHLTSSSPKYKTWAWSIARSQGVSFLGDFQGETSAGWVEGHLARRQKMDKMTFGGGCPHWLHRAGAGLIDSVFRVYWDWPILFILFLLLWTEEAALLCEKGQCEKAIPLW